MEKIPYWRNGNAHRTKMASSLADEIAKLTNPAPKSIDPEDDIYTETAAKVADRFEEYDDDDDGGPRRPQHKQPVFLSSLDTKYAGKATSRSALQEDWGQDYSDDEGVDPSLLQSALDAEGAESSDDDADDDDDDDDDSSQKGSQQKSDLTFNPGVEPFTYQDDSDQDMYESDDDDEEEEESEDEDENADSDDEEDEDDESESGQQDTEEQEGTEAWSFSTPQDRTQDIAKAAATKCQLGLWDSLLESRIKLQKALPLTNQLPQPDARSNFIKTGGDPFTTAAQAGAASLRGLLDTLLELQEELLNQNPETSALTEGGLNGEADVSDEEIVSEESDSEVKDKKPSKKRKREETSDYPDRLQKRHKLTQKFNLDTIEKWSEKTKLASGKYNSKAFSSFNKSVREQIDQILGDQDRLVKRTQLKRSSYKVLGRGADKAGEQDLPAKLDPHLKEYDEEIFDDDDFYHQLLRELIERKTTTDDPTELTKQWLEVQKLRKKVRKKVDTRASKGRKIRYDIHRKLVNFMAPVHNMAMSEEGCNELFSSLFGKKEEKSSKAER